MKKNNVKQYFDSFQKALSGMVVTYSDGRAREIEKAMDKAIGIIIDKAANGGKLMFIGNGGSASIASHMATDFCKNAGIKAMAFNDGSLLTCLGNDCGYEYVFEKPIDMFADQQDTLVAISSSGKSENILRGVKAAKKKKANVITLSGFDKENPLRAMGDINFYVSSNSYGHVENAHHSICHCLVDMVMISKETGA